MEEQSQDRMNWNKYREKEYPQGTWKRWRYERAFEAFQEERDKENNPPGCVPRLLVLLLAFLFRW